MWVEVIEPWRGDTDPWLVFPKWNAFRWLPSFEIVTKVQLPHLYFRNLDIPGFRGTLEEGLLRRGPALDPQSEIGDAFFDNSAVCIR